MAEAEGDRGGEACGKETWGGDLERGEEIRERGVRAQQREVDGRGVGRPGATLPARGGAWGRRGARGGARGGGVREMGIMWERGACVHERIRGSSAERDGMRVGLPLVTGEREIRFASGK